MSSGAKAAFLRLTTQGTPNYRVMARMEYAAIQQLQGDFDGAIASFDQAAAATNDPILKETAQLRAAYIAADTQDFEALQRRLQPLLQSHSRISYLGRELLAIQAWRTGHNDIARTTLQDITLAFDAPEGVRQRAQVTLSLLPDARQRRRARGVIDKLTCTGRNPSRARTRSTSMRPLRPIAIVAAAAALSACATVQRVGAIFGHADATPHNAVPQEGRVSILASDQALTADPSLASRTIVVPLATDVADWTQPGGNETNAPPNANGQATLQQAWRASLGAGTNRHVALSSVPVIAQGRVFFLDANQRVTALDATNGHHLWSVVLRPAHSRDHFAEGGGVAFSEGRLFVTTGYGFMVALDASNGHEVWRAEGNTPYQSSPTVAAGRVYAITNDSTLMALDASNGQVEWNFQAIAEPARIVASPSVAVAGETVIAPFASGELAAVVSANGRRLWGDSLSRPGALTSLSAINDIPGRPVVTNAVVYAASHSGVLVAININTGQRIWAKPFASTQTPA